MCEFCLKHGEGEKWYLQAKNYSDDLLSDIHRRKYIEEFVSHPEGLAENAHYLDLLSKLPMFIRGVVGRIVTWKMKKTHFGQVVPIEDIKQIFDFTNSIVRVACLCRNITLGKEKRYCYGISLSPDGGWFTEMSRALDMSFFTGPDANGFEILTKDEALSAFHEHEREGLCHTVWTFHTPFIGGICNCDRSDCLAMRTTVTHAIPVMFRAEFVAGIDQEECSGCRECMRICQFGAITYSASNKKAMIDQRWCYGCGVCRSACTNNAIRLEERTKVPVAAGLW
jgi:NAD-dependent dihydropyrimidine dehydrogenase PreA subunit